MTPQMSSTPGGDAVERLRSDLTDRDALVCLVIATDDSLADDEVEVDHLFAAGMVKTVRDYGDEHTTILTDAGREFIRGVVHRENSHA